jgi:hypothetical protein
MILEKLELPEELILPDYQANTIANIPATVSALLDVPFDGLPSLRSQLWKPVEGGINRVVLILLDSFGQNLLARERPKLEAFLGRAEVKGTITSVFPSTTVAQHGLVGLRLFFPEYGVLGQLIRFSPNFAPFPDSLVNAGTDPEKFHQVPGFAQQLAMANVATYSLKGREIIHSALSKMHNRGITKQKGFITAADMFVQLREVLEHSGNDKLYVNAYWPSLDTLSHMYGPYHPSVSAELHAVLELFRTIIMEGLGPAARRGTVFIITGDHGQVGTPPYQQIALDDHPSLKDNLLMRPNGEPRSPYLFAKQGKKDLVLRYLQDKLSREMVSWDAEDVLNQGLLGPPPHARETASRMGDIIATMREGHLLLTKQEKKRASHMQGRHGGLTSEEMEVPWLAFRLD